MTHWKKLTNPNYLGVYALEEGKDIIVTIRSVGEETVIGTDGKKENCVVAHFAENIKPMILNATNMKMLTKIFGTPYIEEWTGKKFQVGASKVKAFGEIVEALRVRDKLPQTKTEAIICDECGNELEAVNGKSAQWLAAYTAKKYGKKLCTACATKAAEALKAEQEAKAAEEAKKAEEAQDEFAE